MSRYASRRSVFRHIVLLLAIPLALTSTGYALFSQQLSTNANATKPAYSSSNNLILSYTKTTGSQGQKTVFNFTTTVKNVGTATITAWQGAFDLPSDYGQLNCQSTVSCSTSGSRVTVNNGSGNGTIAAGNSVVFTFSFTSYSTDYTLQNVAIAGTVALTYQSFPGLTVTASAGTRTKQGKWYYWPYTFTVTNASGNNLSAWRIQAPWSTSSNQVSSMPSTVNYVETSTQLTILSTVGLNNGSNFQFVATLGSTNQNYVLTGYTVQGAL